ncbi:PTS transporter subunit EIIC [Corticicoccus populi]|uniref:PTS transporter subunit EIIC n=1 Tax=Corticicoccus populi TaxID=1812821 RepID=A0ABW5WWI6_9STAP
MDKKTIQKIIENVGGENNIKKVWHCMTRLRFDLKDDSLINHEEIKALKDVMGEQLNNDQYQIILGTNVSAYYEAVSEELGKSDDTPETSDSPDKKKGFISRLLDIVSGVFGPVVPAIAGAGMIKGLLAGLIALDILSEDTQTVAILDLIASSVFHFLPFFLAVSAARIFKTNEYLALAVAGGFMYPTLMNAAQEGNISSFSFIGMPIPVIDYSASIIPIILSIWALSHIHKWVDKFMPNVLKTVFTPTVTLFIAIPVALIIGGPLGNYVGIGLAHFVDLLFDISPVLAGIVVGGIRPIAIVFGMHHALTPVALQNFATSGFDMLMPMFFMTNMAIAGATLAMFFKLKNKKDKSIALSAAVSAFLGITEPALFGVLIKYKKAFIACTIGSSIAATFFAVFGVRIYGYILSSIVSLVAYVGPYFTYAIIGIIIAIGVSFLLTYILERRKRA